MPPLPSLDVKSNNLLLVFSSSNQNAGGALGVEVVNTFRHSHPFQDGIVTFSIITESKHSNVLSNSVLKGTL